VIIMSEEILDNKTLTERVLELEKRVARLEKKEK